MKQKLSQSVILLTMVLLGSSACTQKSKTTTQATQDGPLEITVLDVKDPQCQSDQRLKQALTQGEKVMGGVTLATATSIGTLMETPKDFQGKTVRIEGVITRVCQMQGCFLSLKDNTGKVVNLKVKDGTYDFRKVASAGQYAVGEGLFSFEGPHGSQVELTGAQVGTLLCQAMDS